LRGSGGSRSTDRALVRPLDQYGAALLTSLDQLRAVAPGGTYAHAHKTATPMNRNDDAVHTLIRRIP
jgi:hypothetical protein